MKTRTSFVANSSSSSFIIGIKDVTKELPEGCPSFLLKQYKTLMKSITESNGFRTIDELDKHFIDYYGCRNETIEDVLKEPYYKKSYEKYKAFIEEGYVVYDVSVDYSDEYRNDFFSSLSEEDEGDGIVLIESEG